MYAIGSSARRGFGGLFSWGSTDAGGGVNENFRGGAHMDYHQGFGVIPAIAVSAGVSLLSGLFGSHSGKTTHAQRFVQAQQAGDTATAHTLIDQAYSHAFLENIKDKADWMQVWQVMLNEAMPDSLNYMHQKLGVGGTAAGSGGVTGSPNQPGNTPALSSMTSALFSPLGIGLALGLLYLSRRR
jgi:hypothetical protein